MPRRSGKVIDFIAMAMRCLSLNKFSSTLGRRKGLRVLLGRLDRLRRGNWLGCDDQLAVLDHDRLDPREHRSIRRVPGFPAEVIVAKDLDDVIGDRLPLYLQALDRHDQLVLLDPDVEGGNSVEVLPGEKDVEREAERLEWNAHL